MSGPFQFAYMELELERMKRRVEELNAVRQAKDDDIAKLEADIAETDDRVIALEEALRFYAERKHILSCAVEGLEGVENGAVARAALREE